MNEFPFLSVKERFIVDFITKYHQYGNDLLLQLL